MGGFFFNAIEAAVLPCLHFSDANKLGHVVTVGAYFVFLHRRSKRQKWNENVLCLKLIFPVSKIFKQLCRYSVVVLYRDITSDG